VVRQPEEAKAAVADLAARAAQIQVAAL